MHRLFFIFLICFNCFSCFAETYDAISVFEKDDEKSFVTWEDLIKELNRIASFSRRVSSDSISDYSVGSIDLKNKSINSNKINSTIYEAVPPYFLYMDANGLLYWYPVSYVANEYRISDDAYGLAWNGDTTTAPSKNALFDKIETLEASSAGPLVCQGRITLESGVPFSVTDQTNKTVLYFTPYQGNKISLYDGVSSWVQIAFTELSMNISGFAASKPYDIFIYNNSGTAEMEGLVWTNATTRATAIVLQDGRYVKSGDTTRLYVGTIYMDAASKCQLQFGRTAAAGGSAPKCFLWNYYNRVPIGLSVFDSTDSWTYTTLAWRAKNNSLSNAAYVVCGINEAVYYAQNQIIAANSGTNIGKYIGIGLDATNAMASGCLPGSSEDASGCRGYIASSYNGFTGIGYHYIAAIELSGDNGTTTWFGDNGFPKYTQTGMIVNGWY